MKPPYYHDILDILSGTHLAPIFRRVHRVTVVVSILFLCDITIAVVGWLLISPGNVANHVIFTEVMMGILIVCVLFFIAIYLFNDLRHRKYKHLWEKIGAYPCGTCAYPIPYIHKHTTCPECGTRLNTNLAMNYWDQYIRSSVSPISLVAPLLRNISNKKGLRIAISLTYFPALCLVSIIALLIPLSFFVLLYLVPMLVSRRLYRKLLQDDYACYSCLRTLKFEGDMATCPDCDKHSKIESIHKFWHSNAPVHWDIMLENENWEAPGPTQGPSVAPDTEDEMEKTRG